MLCVWSLVWLKIKVCLFFFQWILPVLDKKMKRDSSPQKLKLCYHLLTIILFLTRITFREWFSENDGVKKQNKTKQRRKKSHSVFAQQKCLRERGNETLRQWCFGNASVWSPLKHLCQLVQWRDGTSLAGDVTTRKA